MIRLFSGKLSISFAAFLLFAFSELPSSSRAEDGFWLARSQSGLKRLWGDVLISPPPPPSYARDRLEDDGGNGTVPTKTSSDYLQCGKHALRNTSSRILVDTIEDAVRQGGVALFSEHFRFDSSIGWVVGDNLTGEIDAVIPLRSGKFPDGKEQALFLQPGAVFWPGLKSENRIDVNLGFAYRQYLAPGFPRLT